MSLVFHILDLETTGFSDKHHEISQVSLIRWESREQLSFYVKPDYPEKASYESLVKTGRTMQDLYKGIEKSEAIERVENFFNSDGLTPEHRCIVGHNVSFDRRFCHAFWNQFNKSFPASCWLDTKTLTREYAKRQLGLGKTSLTLEACLVLCGIKPRPGAHNAIIDTQNTYILLHKLKEAGVDYIQHIKRIPHFPDQPHETDEPELP